MKTFIVLLTIMFFLPDGNQMKIVRTFGLESSETITQEQCAGVIPKLFEEVSPKIQEEFPVGTRAKMECVEVALPQKS